MKIMKILIIMICTIIALLAIPKAYTKSYQEIGYSSLPAFWGGCDCDTIMWSGCTDNNPCSRYNGKPSSCAVYENRVNTAWGWRYDYLGYDGANMSNMGKCASLYDCTYNSSTNQCSQGSYNGPQNWYLRCAETQ